MPGGQFEGKTTLLLHTPGRKSGKQFVNPLVAAPYGDSHIVCGSGGGAPQDPQWVANLEAVDGPVTIELGAETAQADHRVVPRRPRRRLGLAVRRVARVLAGRRRVREEHRPEVPGRRERRALTAPPTSG